MRARVAERLAPPGILVMAYQVWHISYGVLAMAYVVMAYLVMARMRARVAEAPAPPVRAHVFSFARALNYICN